MNPIYGGQERQTSVEPFPRLISSRMWLLLSGVVCQNHWPQLGQRETQLQIKYEMQMSAVTNANTNANQIQIQIQIWITYKYKYKKVSVAECQTVDLNWDRACRLRLLTKRRQEIVQLINKISKYILSYIWSHTVKYKYTI